MKGDGLVCLDKPLTEEEKMQRVSSLTLRCLGHLWMAPNTLVSALYLGLFMLAGWVRYAGRTPYALVLKVETGNWIWRHMDGKWAGWTSGAFIIVRKDCIKSVCTLAHEEAHVMQQMVFGVFQPVLYLLFMGFIALALKKKSPYFDNPFEIDARQYAERYASDKLGKQEFPFKP